MRAQGASGAASQCARPDGLSTHLLLRGEAREALDLEQLLARGEPFARALLLLLLPRLPLAPLLHRHDGVLEQLAERRAERGWRRPFARRRRCEQCAPLLRVGGGHLPRVLLGLEAAVHVPRRHTPLSEEVRVAKPKVVAPVAVRTHRLDALRRDARGRGRRRIRQTGRRKSTRMVRVNRKATHSALDRQ